MFVFALFGRGFSALVIHVCARLRVIITCLLAGKIKFPRLIQNGPTLQMQTYLCILQTNVCICFIWRNILSYGNTWMCKVKGNYYNPLQKNWPFVQFTAKPFKLPHYDYM